MGLGAIVGVLEGDRMVGYAEIIGPSRGDAAVDPGHHGRGIGTWLAHWMQDAARALAVLYQYSKTKDRLIEHSPEGDLISESDSSGSRLS